MLDARGVLAGAVVAARVCEDHSVRRLLTAELDLTLAAPAELIFSISAHPNNDVLSESLTFATPDGPLDATELREHAGTRLHAVSVAGGPVAVRYSASVAPTVQQPGLDAMERITYLRPSRYAESDALFGDARRRFRGLSGHDVVDAVRSYVHESLAYAPDGTLGTDSAVTTLATGRGVCRDFAHATIALLRAMDVPARYVSCYAPGLVPMDFHAVTEAYVDGAWHVIDATGLAPREHLVRIATGRDAADCAFLSYYGANLSLDHMLVDAVLDDTEEIPDAAADDQTHPVRIA